MQFRYTSSQTLEPRFGVKYSTTYYRFVDRELAELQQHIYETMVDLIVNNSDQVLQTPLPGFPRTGKQPNYSAWDVVSDMHNQVNFEKKDLPSGMLGRWNRLNDQLNDRFAIDVVKVGSRPKITTNIEQLFKIG